MRQIDSKIDLTVYNKYELRPRGKIKLLKEQAAYRENTQ